MNFKKIFSRAFFVFLILMFCLTSTIYASVSDIEGTWYSTTDGKMVDIWWCSDTQNWRFEVWDEEANSLASGTVQETAGTYGSSYVFITEDSRTFQASYDGNTLSIGELGTYSRECCGGEGSYYGDDQGYPDVGTVGFEPCAQAGVSWECEQQPGMYVIFSPYYGQCNYELYVMDNVIESGTVEVQGNELIFTSTTAGSSSATIMDQCSFRWGQAGVFVNSQCSESGGEAPGPGAQCQSYSTVIPGYMGGYMSFDGEVCGDGTIDGNLVYSNYSLPNMYGNIVINGEASIYIYSDSTYGYGGMDWEINGRLDYTFPMYGIIQVEFDNVVFVTNMYGQAISAQGYMYVNGMPYPVTPDIFYMVFGF